jgi:6-phosphogluconolactonase (cycloisomerase 2 family)
MSPATIATGGANSQHVAADPAGKCLYVANVSSNTVSQFGIGANGTLTALTPPTVAAGTYPMYVAIDPTGRYAYAANNQSADVSQYTIGADCRLTSAGTASAGGWPKAPSSIAIDPAGRNLYVANNRDNSVSQYRIDQATGTLSPASTVAAGGTPGYYGAWRVTVEPSGRYAYVTNYFDGTVSQYGIDQADGTLSPLSPALVDPSWAYASSVAADPAGKYLYVGNPGAGTPSSVVAQYQIGANGALSPLSPATVSAGGAGVSAMTTVREASGDYAYATSGDTGWGQTTIAQYRIDPATGALQLLSNPTVQAGFGPSAIVAVGR